MISIKENLKDLKPYKPNQQQYQIKLDANESRNYLFPNGLDLKNIDVNRYPDTNSDSLREAISIFNKTDKDLIITGNGSSEMIELILKTFIDKNDIVLSFEPSFSMYKIYTQIHNGRYIPVQSQHDLSFQMDDMIEAAKKYQPKIIFICSPNNPTGYLIPNQEIIRLVKQTNALVVLDEAYMEFTRLQESLISLVESFSNLIVLRTLSKAFGLAGIRLGYLVGNKDLVETLNRVKSPYNLNVLTQRVGAYALSKIDMMTTYTNDIMDERERVENELKKLRVTLYPSQANFVFFQSSVENLFSKLLEKGILIRAFDGILKSYYRVTVGEKEENEALINALKEIII